MATFAVLGGCKAELFGKLNESDANAVLDALYSEGIRAEKIMRDREVWAIEVPEGDLQRALRLTQERGVPRERFATMGDLFKKEGLVSSPSEERLRYIFAVSQELANTLTQIDGVMTARVHPVIPANDPLADRVKPASASVFIKHQAQADVQQMAPAIRNLVSRSIEGLSPDNVSLTFFSAAAPRAAVPPSSNGWAEFGRGWWGEALVLVLLAAAALASYLWRAKRAPDTTIDVRSLPGMRTWWGGATTAKGTEKQSPRAGETLEPDVVSGSGRS
ncbi:MAG: type III secretion inner membrane ring lipoprotein SctJ [Pseudomonadota bacterium]